MYHKEKKSIFTFALQMKGAIIYLFINLLCMAGVSANQVDSLFKKADVFFRSTNYSNALEQYFQVLRISEKENNPELIIKSTWAIGRCYYYLRDRNQTLKWFIRALQTAQLNQLDSLLPRANYHVSSMYIEAHNLDSAIKYSNKAIELGTKLKDFAIVSQTYSTLAELYINTSKNKNNIETAIANAEKFAILANSKTMLAFAKSKRYNYAFFLKKDYHEALTYINDAESLYAESSNYEAKLNTYRGKAECLIMLRDTAALRYMLRWFAFKDSVLKAEKLANIAKFETLYKTEKKEIENKQLQHENELNRLKIQSNNRTLIIVISISLLLLLVTLWLLAKNSLKKKQQELVLLQNLQKDKERIARDLHDNVGGQLSYIIYSLDGIIDDNKEKRLELSKDIDQAVRSVISNLRETIWAISDANISVHDFSDKLKVFAKKLFKHSSTQIYFSEDIQAKELNALLSLNLFRICQEILNNALKHAKAKELKILFYTNTNKFSILILDDGIGFDTATENNRGYGLQNIMKRANEFGIEIKMESSLNKGTKYELTV